MAQKGEIRVRTEGNNGFYLVVTSDLSNRSLRMIMRAEERMKRVEELRSR